jgi:hypothetical protein
MSAPTKLAPIRWLFAGDPTHDDGISIPMPPLLVPVAVQRRHCLLSRRLLRASAAFCAAVLVGALLWVIVAVASS